MLVAKYPLSKRSAIHVAQPWPGELCPHTAEFIPETTHLSGQVALIRDNQGVGEPLTPKQVAERMENYPHVVASTDPNLRLLGGLGYAVLEPGPGRGARIIEIAISSELTASSHRHANRIGMRWPRHQQVLGALLGAIIHLSTDEVVRVASTAPSEVGVESMETLALEQNGAFFEGDPLRILAAIRNVGLRNELPVQAPRQLEG